MTWLLVDFELSDVPTEDHQIGSHRLVNCGPMLCYRESCDVSKVARPLLSILSPNFLPL